MSTFLKYWQISSLINGMTSYEDSETSNRLPKVGKEQISTYLAVANWFLKLNAMNLKFAITL